MKKLNMSFSIKDNKLLEKCNETWDKVSKVIKKGFNSDPAYNGKYLKTKMNSYEEKVNTIFHNDKYQKRVLIVLVDSVFKMGKNYYP